MGAFKYYPLHASARVSAALFFFKKKIKRRARTGCSNKNHYYRTNRLAYGGGRATPLAYSRSAYPPLLVSRLSHPDRFICGQETRESTSRNLPNLVRSRHHASGGALANGYEVNAHGGVYKSGAKYSHAKKIEVAAAYASARNSMDRVCRRD